MNRRSLAELRRLLAETSLDSLDQLLKLLDKDERRGARELAQKMRRKLSRKRHEKERVARLLRYELDLWERGLSLVAGCDEAGRGALAGPLVAAAVILDRDVFIEGIDDSKKLSPAARERVAATIEEGAMCWATAFIGPKEIDEHGIQAANLSALSQAVENLPLRPDYILSDGFPLKSDIPGLAIIKGDSISLTVAAASIIAKVHRDRLMKSKESEYSGYGFSRHKGYGTADHLETLARLGPSPIHRRTFAPVGGRSRSFVDS